MTCNFKLQFAFTLNDIFERSLPICDCYSNTISDKHSNVLFIHFFIISLLAFPLERIVAGEVAQRSWNTSRSTAIPDILLAPDQGGTKQNRTWATPSGPWTTSGPLFHGLASRTCLTILSWDILDKWPKQAEVTLFGGEVIRYSSLYEFHSCTVCRSVSHCELFTKSHRRRLHIRQHSFSHYPRFVTMQQVRSETKTD